MSVRWYVLRRAAWAVLVLYLVLSLAFVAAALPADPNKAFVRLGAALSGEDPKEAVDAYEAARNQDRPLVDRYVGWLVGMATGDWGYSYVFRDQVKDLLVDRLKTTLSWVVPAVLLAPVLAVVLGWAWATWDRRVVLVLVAVAYLGLAVPNFLFVVFAHDLVDLVVEVEWTSFQEEARTSTAELPNYVLGVVTLALTLAASGMRFARAEVLELARTDLVKVVRAKGGGSSVVARHVLRNAAIPLLTFFVTDLVQVLILGIYVLEAVLGIPGVTELVFEAIPDRDVAPVMTTTLLLVVFVVVANFVEDVAYAVLDPRIDLEE